MKIKKHILTIGLNDRETKHQIFTTKQAIKKVENVLQQFTNGYTIFNTTGGYRHDNGYFVNEKSIRVELDFITKKQVLKIIDKIKSKDCLNQESVVYAVQKLNTSLI